MFSVPPEKLRRRGKKTRRSDEVPPKVGIQGNHAACPPRKSTWSLDPFRLTESGVEISARLTLISHLPEMV